MTRKRVDTYPCLWYDGSIKEVSAMTDKEIIKTIMKNHKISSPTLANQLGYKQPSGVTEKLRRKQSMRVDTFSSFLQAMGCTLTVKDGDATYTVTFDNDVSELEQSE